MNLAFQVQKAVREKIYVKIALMSPSGGGKTYSSLRLATGMAKEIERQTGRKAKILMGNTEQARGRYYANEFEYDIVDIDPPHNPEKYVEFIEFAASSGYDIVIIDSASHEWEGKGGCLELQQQAGGTYQAWGKVSPRHNKFIEAITSSPIHIIATMRGKDQYEMEKDDRGKTSVHKLGVGAKQRDGFEYEFTCTFMIDQKTSMAEAQKDNTHIFEGETAVLLSEAHGEKIIKWANSSNIEPVKKVDVADAVVDKANTQKDQVDDLNILKRQVLEVATRLVAIDQPGTMNIIMKYVPSGNPNAVANIEDAQALFKELKEKEGN